MQLDLQGTHVALVTPFLGNGEIDVSSLKHLLDYQLEGGVDGLVLAGTTGEGATLSISQLETLVTTTIRHVQDQVLITVGTGSNNTVHAVELTQKAKDFGADAALSVGPYYNKPTQEGYYQHFETVVRLSRLPNIVAIKESTADLLQLSYLVRHCPPSFTILSGDDYMALPSIALGAKGVVSVIGNEAPRHTSQLIQAALQQDFVTARRIHLELLPLMDINFVETNPIPVKCALSMMGLIEEHYHLPMTPSKQCII